MIGQILTFEGIYRGNHWRIHTAVQGIFLKYPWMSKILDPINSQCIRIWLLFNIATLMILIYNNLVTLLLDILQIVNKLNWLIYHRHPAAMGVAKVKIQMFKNSKIGILKLLLNSLLQRMKVKLTSSLMNSSNLIPCLLWKKIS